MTYQKLKSNFLFAFYFVVLIFAFCFLNFKVSAQELSLGISPPLLEIVIKPNKSIMVAYKIDNYADPVIARAKILPFEPLGNQGNIKIAKDFSGPVRFSLDNSDLDLEKPFFMKTRESKQLLLRMRLPEGTPDGDYYYTLLIETEPPPTVDGSTGGRAKGTIGANILITVTGSGMTEISGKIVLFDVISKFKPFGWKIFDSNAKIPVVLNVQNNGKNMIKAEGEIVLNGNFGEKATYQIPAQNILAQSQRLVFATPSAEINQPTSLVLSGFFLGKYKLAASLNIGESLTPLTASTSFVALPFRWIIGLIFALIISLILIKRLSRNEDEDEA